jgi:hypothetical protein
MLRLPAKVGRLRPNKRSRCKLPFPVEPTLRIAQISAGPIVSSAQQFPREKWDQLPTFRPGVLLGSAADLQTLAKHVKLGLNDLTSLDRAIFVLTECGDLPVSDVCRVVLWQAFGVPVYELLVGFEGTLLASECAAQEGWHIEPGAVFSLANDELMLDAAGRKHFSTGLTGRLETELCPCGRTGMRLMDLEVLTSTSDERQLAATA